MKDRQQEMMRELADRMNAVGFEPIGMAAAKEKIQEHLNDNAKPEKDAARKTAEYWKAEHLAGNAIIESLRAELAELRARVSEPVAWMHNKRVDVIHTSVKSLLSDFAVNSGPESMLRPIDKSEHYTIPLYAAPVPAQPAADVAAIAKAVRDIPSRIESLGGQRFAYVKLSEVIDTIYSMAGKHPAVPEDVAKDAERYRWIRSDMKMLWGDDVLAIIGESGASFDAAIDAAILAADTEGRKDGGAR